MTTKDHTAALREAIARHFPEDPANAVRAYAALTEVLSQPQQPAGWKVVPVEPTSAMIEASCIAHASATWPDGYGVTAQEMRRKQARDGWRMLLANAPTAHPSQQEDMSTYKRMFEAAVRDLAAISKHLGLDPNDDGGAEPIIYAIDELRSKQQEDGARDADEGEPERFVVLKASGSRYAYVNDTQLSKTVKRYDVLRGDGWADAKRHAERLNRDAAMSAAQGDAAQGGGNAA